MRYQMNETINKSFKVESKLQDFDRLTEWTFDLNSNQGVLMISVV